MNDTAYKWKDQGASLLKIASLVTALTLSNFSLVHSSRGYYDEEYPGEAYHQQAGQNYHSQFRALKLSDRPQSTRLPLRAVQQAAAPLILREIPYYAPRSALWLTVTPKPTAQKYASSIPPTSSERRLVLSNMINTSEWQNSIELQNPLGTCSSFAGVEVLKFIHGRLLSQPYLIVKAEAQQDCLNNGLPIGRVMEQIHLSGVIGQSWWPYPEYVETVKTMNRGVSNDKQWNVCMTLPATIKQEDEIIKFRVQNILNLFASSRQICTGSKCTFDKSELLKKSPDTL